MLFIFLLAVSLSIDALGVGITYGVRDITISNKTKLLLAVESALLMAIFLFAGNQLTLLVSPTLAKKIGVGLLFFMGLWLCIQCFLEQKNTTEENTPMSMVHTPSACDWNHSSNLEPKEAIYLCFILSMDSLGAGIGAGAAGISMSLLPICVAFCQTFFLTIGSLTGKKLKHITPFPEHLWSAVSGILLMIIAFLRLKI